MRLSLIVVFLSSVFAIFKFFLTNLISSSRVLHSFCFYSKVFHLIFFLLRPFIQCNIFRPNYLSISIPLYLSLSLSRSICIPLSLILTLSHTHAHTHAHAHMHTHTFDNRCCCCSRTSLTQGTAR